MYHLHRSSNTSHLYPTVPSLHQRPKLLLGSTPRPGVPGLEISAPSRLLFRYIDLAKNISCRGPRDIPYLSLAAGFVSDLHIWGEGEKYRMCLWCVDARLSRVGKGLEYVRCRFQTVVMMGISM